MVLVLIALWDYTRPRWDERPFQYAPTDSDGGSLCNEKGFPVWMLEWRVWRGPDTTLRSDEIITLAIHGI